MIIQAFFPHCICIQRWESSYIGYEVLIKMAALLQLTFSHINHTTSTIIINNLINLYKLLIHFEIFSWFGTQELLYLQSLACIYISLTYFALYLIYHKGSYTHRVSRHNFPRHLIATSTDQQYIQQEVKQSAFNQAFFAGLSDVHEYLGNLQMAPYSLNK